VDIKQRNSKIGRQTPPTWIDASRYQDVVVRESFRREGRKDIRRRGVSQRRNAQFTARIARGPPRQHDWKECIMKAARGTGFLFAGAVLAVAVSACGSSGSTASTATVASTPAPTSNQASSAKPSAAAPTSHLAILSPRAGGHTGSTLTVRVAASGAPSGAQRFRYVLDGRFTRSGATHVTFHELAPGRHRLEVVMLGSGDRANTTFTVNAPSPTPAPAPVATTSTPAEAPHTTPAPAPTPTPASQVPPKTPVPKPTPPAEKAPPPPAKTAPSGASEGIPQGPGAGDGDGDNNGEPSDGDGNI
jgi:hypothetical protein